MAEFDKAPQPSSSASDDARQGLSDLVAGVPGVLYGCDQNLTVVEISPAAFAVLDVDVSVLLSKRSLWDELVFPDDRQSLMTMLEELPKGHVASLTHRVLDRRGLPRWVAHSFRKTGEGGLLRGCILPLPTENCTKDLISTIIPQFVHKIGNHFQLMNLLVGNLRRRGLPEADLDSLQNALDETVDFTRTFLNYAQAPNAFSEFDLSEILKALMQTMEPIFAEKKVALRSLLDKDFNDVTVVGDPFLIENAFSAILENALGAIAETGEVSVMARVEKHPPDNQFTGHVVIADTGGGLDREVVARAVEPFFSTRRGHSGLGLSTALRTTEQHGGRLWITSELGQGAQVHVVLPVLRTSRTPDR